MVPLCSSQSDRMIGFLVVAVWFSTMSLLRGTSIVPSQLCNGAQPSRRGRREWNGYTRMVTWFGLRRVPTPTPSPGAHDDFDTDSPADKARVRAWARATPLGSLRVVHGPANDGDDHTMYAECDVA